MSDDGKIEIENVMSPGRTKRVDRDKYRAVREAVMASLDTASPGMTEAELKAAVLDRVSSELFPGGEKLGWWLGAVRLDLEAKKIVAREDTKPKRYRRTI